MEIHNQGPRTSYLVFVILQQGTMLQIWVELDLVDCGWGLASLEDPFKMLLKVVTYTNRLGEPLGFDFFHLSPFFLVLLLVLAEKWSMDQVQVNVVQL